MSRVAKCGCIYRDERDASVRNGSEMSGYLVKACGKHWPQTAPAPSDIDGPAGEAGDLIVAWEGRMFIGGRWTGWCYCDNPKRFREGLEFNIDNGTAELRGLVPASALAAYQAALKEAQTEYAIERTHAKLGYDAAANWKAKAEAAEAKVGELEARLDVARTTAKCREEERDEQAVLAGRTGEQLFWMEKDRDAAEAKVAALTAEIEALKAERDHAIATARAACAALTPEQGQTR